MSPKARIEEALAHARAIVDLVQQPLAMLDRELRLRHANPAFYELFDLDAEAVGKRLAEIRDVFDIPGLVERLVSVVESGMSLRDYEVTRQFPSGTKTLVVQASALAAPRENADVLMVSFDDVSERRATERALRQHQCLLAAITDTVITLDTGWHILSWNAAAENFLGFTAEEALGKRSDDFIVFDRKVSREQLERGDIVSVQGRIKQKSGTWVDMESATVPVRDTDGSALGYVVIIHDIRETKQLERQLREHAEDVEEANKELDSFTYSVSHDLRAPLRAIDGFSRILVEDFSGRMSKEELRLLDVIRKNAHQMGQLIDDLLAFSRLGRKELSIGYVDMKDLLVGLVPEVLAGTEHRVIDLRAKYIPPCIGDKALLRQVWTNLLGNAVKYTRHREQAVISISGEEIGDELVYRIEDNGAGFDMQYIDKLFGVFQRLHKPAEFEGTGVGLALVARIVRRHGGRVWAEGRPGSGATFSFSLPRRNDG
jgi:two-component system sensor kinase